MKNLFGEHVLEPVQKAPKKQAFTPAIEPLPVAIRRPWPGGKVAKAWAYYNWQPQAGIVTHFNAAIGFDLQAKRRLAFGGLQGWFGYILQLNDVSGEVVVHVPKPLQGKGTDGFFVVAMSDLLPPQLVADFDGNQFVRTRPMLPCPRLAEWGVNPLLS